jgi:hypothetical protein
VLLLLLLLSRLLQVWWPLLPLMRPALTLTCVQCAESYAQRQ